MNSVHCRNRFFVCLFVLASMLGVGSIGAGAQTLTPATTARVGRSGA